jgi:hypothetical protein
MRTPLSLLVVGLIAGAASANEPAPAAPAPAPTTTTTPAAAPIPATYGEIVNELRTQATGLDAAMGKNNGPEMRKAAQRIQDLAGAVAGKVDTLSADARTAATTTAARIKSKAGEVMTSVDKGDIPGAKTAVGAIKTDVEDLAKHVPKK